uniref:Uncharacterized protein n=1 Tax=Arundo donax TaxID=35708 RepID=A0A0A8YY15_ARUDO
MWGGGGGGGWVAEEVGRSEGKGESLGRL